MVLGAGTAVLGSIDTERKAYIVSTEKRKKTDSVSVMSIECVHFSMCTHLYRFCDTLRPLSRRIP